MLAQELVDLLEENQIEFERKESALNDHAVYMGSNPFDTEITISIPNTDFERADEILAKESKKTFDQITPDYYLLEFSNEELLEIIMKSDEWSAFDFELAKHLLEQRGEKIDAEKIEALKANRINELKKSEPRQFTWIIAGYFFAVCGGLIGIFIGWHLAYFRKTLPNGEKTSPYFIMDRIHGKRMMYLGIFSALIWTIFKIINNPFF